MTSADLLPASVLKRKAVVYVRQSTPAQVQSNLEGEWNDKLRALAKAEEERQRARQEDQLVRDEAIGSPP